MGLHFHDSTGASVIVANGDRVACRGIARDVSTRIGEEYFAINCYAIPLECYDMVLGISFLKTLGAILWDFEDLCMAFWHQGRRVLWKGIGSDRWDIPPTGRLNSIRDTETPLLHELLDTFQDVFEPPSGLPPQRQCDHHIHLLPNTTPVAVRP